MRVDYYQRQVAEKAVKRDAPGVVLVRKGFRYRIYPTYAQEARLLAWESALRFLWNLAHEQRLMGLSRTEKRYPTAFEQMLELTELRAELPWLADVPRNVCAQLLTELDLAWQRCFKRLARKPRWKRKGHGALGLRESHPKIWRLDGQLIRFPKLGNLRAVVHRPLAGKPKTCTITRDGDQWFASIVCESEIPEPAPSTKPGVGIDRGVVNLLADSDGRIVVNPKHLEKMAARVARAQRVVARRKKGSKNREKAKARVARLHRKVRRQRDHVLHVESGYYAKNHGVIVIEKLHIGNMTASASGTIEKPGSNVRQKAGLNRSILAAGWGRFATMLRYKVIPEGGEVREVPAAYSSRECHACGHTAAENRPSQAVFECVACGVVEHADINAAKVIYSRANRSALPVDGSASKGPGRSRKRLSVARRSPKTTSLRRGLITHHALDLVGYNR